MTTPIPAPTTTRPAYAPTNSTFASLPMMSTNRADVTAHVPISPNRRHPAHRSARPTTTATDSALGARTTSTPRAIAAPTRIARIAWVDSRTERASVLVVATTAPSGA